MTNSFFTSLIEDSGLEIHDGRKLWQYELSPDEYQKLKNHLRNLSGSVDCRDFALYFAEWWRNEYNEGIPSKELVYNSLGNCKISLNEFYKLAKKGIERLGIPWLQRTNHLFFRTLLLQGGLPINHMSQRSGAYTNFLKKVIEIEPESIEDFEFDTDITKYLPYSCRNEVIFESCLEIAKSINRGDDDFSILLTNSNKTSNSLNKMFSELKEFKKTIDKKRKANRSFKAFWILEEKNGNGTIKLSLKIPSAVSKEYLSEMLRIDEFSMISNYQLIINDELVCKIRKTIGGDYKVLREERWEYVWQGEDAIPVVYLLGDNTKYNFPIILPNAIDLTTPVMLTALGEHIWQLHKGRNCKDETAGILYSNEWNPSKIGECIEIKLMDKPFRLINFESSITLNHQEDSITFNTDKTVFDWHLINPCQPNWLLKSNVPVVCHRPEFQVFKNNEYFPKPIITYRKLGEYSWHDLATFLPVGYLEIKIEVDGLVETDYIFNIAKFDLSYSNRNECTATININVKNFDFIIKPNVEIEIMEDDYGLNLSSTDVNKIPDAIKCALQAKEQNRALHIEIAPPFLGVGMLNAKGKLHPKTDVIINRNYNGYRLYSSLSDEELTVHFYNIERPDIRISKPLTQQLTPLRIYDDIINRLLSLKNAMHWHNKVQVEIVNSSDKIIAAYTIQSYNQMITKDESKVILKNGGDSVNVYGIPVSCSSANLAPVLFENKNGTYTLPNDVSSFLNKFVLVAEDTLGDAVFMPTFFTYDVEISKSNSEERVDRINNYIEDLKEKKALDDLWQSILKYIKICDRFKVPYSSIDQLTAVTSTPSVSAKLFCLLSIYAEDSDFLINEQCETIENDFGFCFHWICTEHWQNALDWVKISYSDSYADSIFQLELQVMANISNLLRKNHPHDNYDQIAKYILGEKIQESKISHLNTEVINIRQNLGDKVLNMLPKAYMSIPNELQYIIPFKENWKPVALLLNAPLIVALSISGKHQNIWNYKISNGDEIRRNIQYVSWLVPDWYSALIVHCLTKIN